MQHFHFSTYRLNKNDVGIDKSSNHSCHVDNKTNFTPAAIILIYLDSWIRSE